MSSRYVRVPNPSGRHPHNELDEVEAAFDYREEDDDDQVSESQPLNRNASQAPPVPQNNSYQPVNVPGTYDFETVDYDYPPPGSPPPLSARALPNEIGNSNGMVPDFGETPLLQPRQPWWKRTVTNVLPSSVADRLGVSSSRPTGLVGGGTNNDGVFANVTAKPTPPIRVQNGDETYLVPEEAQQEAPPSYASAQADAVPPYWETTIHAPFSPESMGEMIVDSLPTGSLFSFCWNMLVSISFQFVGFLLTYLLHTSHAARLGSRAGLGVTLIQYGFALRGKLDNADGGDDDSSPWSNFKATLEHPTFHSSAEAEAWIEAHRGLANLNATSIPTPEDQTNAMLADATAEWLSFFLMTIGWFVLLTSVLGFYRVKRWERSILAQQQRDTPNSAPPSSGIETAFSLRGMSRIELLRNGFGFGRRRNVDGGDAGSHNEPNSREIESAPLDPSDPRHEDLVANQERERRLMESLRSASLL